MTEPTWKDELLQRWSQTIRAGTREWLKGVFRAGERDALTMLEMLKHQSAFSTTADESRDYYALRSIIDAELARGREAGAMAEEMTRRWATEDGSPAYAVAKCILEAFNAK